MSLHKQNEKNLIYWLEKVLKSPYLTKINMQNTFKKFNLKKTYPKTG